jgi:hypothetical protein
VKQAVVVRPPRAQHPVERSDILEDAQELALIAAGQMNGRSDLAAIEGLSDLLLEGDEFLCRHVVILLIGGLIVRL